MAKISGSTRAAPLKTYSRRVNSTTERLPGKRKLSEDPQSVPELPPSKKFARSSIQSYFQPLSSSSSAATTRPSIQSSDDLDPGSTPPSSPPSRAGSPLVQKRRPQKRPKRRLSTRPKSIPAVRSKTMELPTTDSAQPLASRAIGPGGFPINYDQLRLNPLGACSATMVVCPKCNWLYDKTVPEERKKHDTKHQEYLTCGSGLLQDHDVAFLGDLAPCYYEVGGETLRYIKADNKSSAAVKAVADLVVKMANKDLGHKDDHLWGNIANPRPAGFGTRTGKYTVFVTLLGKYPVAALVATHIAQAGVFMFGEASLVDISNKISMCVDRIWVKEEYRRGAFHGMRFASILLDVARRKLFANPNNPSNASYRIPKSEVAMSHPTSLGYEFACHYFKGVFDDMFPNNKHRKILVNSAEGRLRKEPVKLDDSPEEFPNERIEVTLY